MSRLACPCGGVITNVAHPSASEGWLVREQDEEAFAAALCRDITALFAAIHNGEREKWIRQRFTDSYPTDVNDETLVDDIIAFHAGSVGLSVCECSQCGRLHVQRNIGVNSYISYAPDEGGCKGILHSSGGLNEAVETWSVVRQDDNGNRFVVSDLVSESEAIRLVAEFEARGHKQTYWIERSKQP